MAGHARCPSRRGPGRLRRSIKSGGSSGFRLKNLWAKQEMYAIHEPRELRVGVNVYVVSAALLTWRLDSGPRDSTPLSTCAHFGPRASARPRIHARARDLARPTLEGGAFVRAGLEPRPSVFAAGRDETRGEERARRVSPTVARMHGFIYSGSQTHDAERVAARPFVVCHVA